MTAGCILNSMRTSEMEIPVKSVFTCTDCGQRCSGYGVPYFMLLFKRWFNLSQLAAIQCERCDAIISRECKNHRMRKVVRDATMLFPRKSACPSCGKPLDVRTGVLRENTDLRLLGQQLSTIRTNLAQGRVRRRLDLNHSLDLVFLPLAAVAMVLTSVDLLQSQEEHLLPALVLLGAAVLVVCTLIDYVKFVRPWFHLFQSAAYVTAGVGGIIMNEVPRYPQYLMPFAFVLILWGLWGAIRYRAFKSNVSTLQKLASELTSLAPK